MATCSYCSKDIPDDSTVCRHCGAFEPFSSQPHPRDPDDSPAFASDPEGPLLESAEDEEVDQGNDGSGCWNFIKDLGCNYAIGCGGILVAAVFGVVIALIAGVCAGGEREVDCQELHNWAINDPEPWGYTETDNPLLDFKILEIDSELEKDRPEPGMEVCRGVAQTTDGPESIWFVFDGDGSFTVYTGPLNEPAPAPEPAPKP